MGSIGNSRKLRRRSTNEEKALWRALRDRQFAGFKFRRQHPVGTYSLDFYCAQAKLSIELDGFKHGSPGQNRHDEARKQFLKEQGAEELRFWNQDWRKNPEGCLLAIWNAVQRRTGCVQIAREEELQSFVPPNLKSIKSVQRTNPSPRLAGRGR